jgi:hypothetical protein
MSPHALRLQSDFFAQYLRLVCRWHHAFGIVPTAEFYPSFLAMQIKFSGGKEGECTTFPVVSSFLFEACPPKL